ncbi:hypothetical protein LCGC14_2575360, partial [marine sediment metagenome]
ASPEAFRQAFDLGEFRGQPRQDAAPGFKWVKTGGFTRGPGNVVSPEWQQVPVENFPQPPVAENIPGVAGQIFGNVIFPASIPPISAEELQKNPLLAIGLAAPPGAIATGGLAGLGRDVREIKNISRTLQADQRGLIRPGLPGRRPPTPRAIDGAPGPTVTGTAVRTLEQRARSLVDLYPARLRDKVRGVSSARSAADVSFGHTKGDLRVLAGADLDQQVAHELAHVQWRVGDTSRKFSAFLDDAGISIHPERREEFFAEALEEAVTGRVSTIPEGGGLSVRTLLQDKPGAVDAAVAWIRRTFPDLPTQGIQVLDKAPGRAIEGIVTHSVPPVSEPPIAIPPSGRPRTLLDLNREAKGMKAMTPEQRAAVMDSAKPIESTDLLYRVQPFESHAERLLGPDKAISKHLRSTPGLKQVAGLVNRAQMERSNPVAMIGIRKEIFREIEKSQARFAGLRWWHDAQGTFGFRRRKGIWT